MNRVVSFLRRLNWPFLIFIAVIIGTLYLWTHGREAEEKRLRRTKAEAAPAVSDQNLQKFSLTGFDEKGQKFWNLEGDTAKIDIGQTVFLEENVTLRLRDDTVVRTDHVQWSQDGGVLTTNSPVFVDHLNVKIEGKGATGRLSENFIQLNREIKMRINQATQVTCDGPMKIYYNQNKMVFYRNVRVKDDRGVLTARRMDVFFHADKQEVETIIATGDVVIERGTDTTKSRRAIYTVSNGAVRLEGNPEITLHKSSSSILNGPSGNKGSEKIL